LGLFVADFGMADYSELLKLRGQRILAALDSNTDRKKAALLLEDIIRYILSTFEKEVTFQNEVEFHKSLVPNLSGPLSYEIANELDYRLSLLSEYHFSSYNRILAFLKSGLNTLTSATLTGSHVSLIKILNEKPNQGIVALARQLKASPRTVRRNQQKLFNQFGFRIGAILDIHRFGLSHYGLCFRTHGIDFAHNFESWIQNPANANIITPFFLGYGFDLENLDGYCSFFIPDKIRAIKKMEKRVKWLEKKFFESTKLLKIQGNFSNVNFDSYDYISQQWSMSADLSTEGTLSFIKEHGLQFSLPRGVHYSTTINRFNVVDWLLALMCGAGFLNKSERVTTLARYGFPIAKKTAWAHERKLARSQTLIPVVMFGNLAFEDIICIIIQCEDQVVANLVQLVLQFAYCRIHPTTEGVIFFIGVPTGGSGLIRHLTRTLIQETSIHELTILRLKQDIPQAPSLETYALWDNEGQHWKSD
jgi:hypothetical protein